MSASFQTLNSGAFRSLHCLIYKVLAPLRSARNIHYFTTTFSVCQALFSTFFKVFCARLSKRLLGSSAILPQTFPFVKYFFRLFSKSFSQRSSGGPFIWQLDYFTTAPRLCQALFSIFSRIFCKIPVPTAPLGDSSLNIPLHSCFVKCFLQKNRNFPKIRHTSFLTSVFKDTIHIQFRIIRDLQCGFFLYTFN